MSQDLEVKQKELAQAVEADFKERSQAAKVAIDAVLEQHKLALVGVPIVEPDGRLGAVVVFQPKK
jgi:hypothetical protein